MRLSGRHCGLDRGRSVLLTNGCDTTCDGHDITATGVEQFDAQRVERATIKSGPDQRQRQIRIGLDARDRGATFDGVYGKGRPVIAPQPGVDNDPGAASHAGSKAIHRQPPAHVIAGLVSDPASPGLAVCGQSAWADGARADAVRSAATD